MHTNTDTKCTSDKTFSDNEYTWVKGNDSQERETGLQRLQMVKQKGVKRQKLTDISTSFFPLSCCCRQMWVGGLWTSGSNINSSRTLATENPHRAPCFSRDYVCVQAIRFEFVTLVFSQEVLVIGEHPTVRQDSSVAVKWFHSTQKLKCDLLHHRAPQDVMFWEICKVFF